MPHSPMASVRSRTQSNTRSARSPSWPSWRISARPSSSCPLERQGLGFRAPPGQGGMPWSVQRRDFRAPIILALTGAAILLSLNSLDPKLGSLAAVMAKIDLFAFGGAFGSLPLMLHEVVEVRHWLEPGPFLDGIALGQVTPGPVMVTAAFVGWHLANFAGALVATVGIFFPSFVILLACRPIAERLRRHRSGRTGNEGDFGVSCWNDRGYRHQVRLADQMDALSHRAGDLCHGWIECRSGPLMGRHCGRTAVRCGPVKLTGQMALDRRRAILTACGERRVLSSIICHGSAVLH